MTDELKLRNERIRKKALEVGFTSCGFAEASYLKREHISLKNYLSNHHHGKMNFLEKNVELRSDPRLLFDGAKSVIALALNYFPKETQNTKTSLKVSKYAYGKDYHRILKSKLRELTAYIQETEPDVVFRSFVDSAPVFEKAWAARAGLGWIGKNTLLINSEYGSFCFLGLIITNLEFEYGHPEEDKCGNCRKCLDACPTNALAEPYHLNTSLCISYHTIEDETKVNFPVQNKEWIYGCDICQDVCPWNKGIKPSQEEQFKISSFIRNAGNEDWENLNDEEFNHLFQDSSIIRCGYENMMKNIGSVNKNRGIC